MASKTNQSGYRLAEAPKTEISRDLKLACWDLQSQMLWESEPRSYEICGRRK